MTPLTDDAAFRMTFADDSAIVSHESSSSLNTDSSSKNEEEEESIAKGGVSTPFPWKLHIMLDAVEETGDTALVSWAAHGRAFTVHKPREFVDRVLPQYFNQSKYASFQRQLNLYGFHRLISGPDKGAYWHDCFVRGKPNLCRGMVRQKIKGNKVRRSMDKEEEPNFYNPSLGPLDVPFITSPEALAHGAISATARSSKPKKKSGTSKTVAKTAKGKTMAPTASSKSRASLHQGHTTSLVSLATSQSFPTSALPAKEYGMNQAGTSHRMDLRPTSASAVGVSSAVVSADPSSYTLRIEDSQAPQELAQPTGHDARGGDVVFFEGQPFRYLEHLEELPPPTVNSAPLLRSQGNRDQAETLQDMITAVVNLASPRNVCSV